MIWREKFSWMFLWSKRALGSFIHYLTCTRKWSQALDSIIQKFQRKKDVMFWGEISVERLDLMKLFPGVLLKLHYYITELILLFFTK